MASRRKHQRFGCSIPASVQLERTVLDANIVNFCAQGLLINCSPETAQSLATSLNNASYRVVLSCHVNDIQQQLDLKIRRADGPYFGLFAPEGLPPLFFDALTQHATGLLSSALDLEQPLKKPFDTNRQRLLAQDIVQCCHTHINQSVRQFFERLPDTLMDGAGRAAATEVQSLYDISTTTRANASVMSEQFKDLLNSQICQSLQGSLAASTSSAPITGAHSPGLSLVEADAFDRWMSVKATAQRIENHVHQPLSGVVNRLKPLFATPEETPMLPRGQAKLLQEVLEQYGYAQKPLKIALDAFAMKLIGVYDDYLVKMNAILEKHGYFQAKAMPATQKSRSAVPSPSQTVRWPTAQQKDKVGAGLLSGADEVEPSVQDRMTYVHELLKNLQGSRGNPTNVTVSDELGADESRAGMSQADRFDLVSLEQEQLISILHDFFRTGWQSTNSALHFKLLHRAQIEAKERGAKLTASDTATLELVDAFFDDTMRNMFLIEDVRTLLNKFRSLFAAEFLTQGVDFYAHSSLRTIIFSLHSIAHEPMSWLGRHKKTILDAFAAYQPLPSGEIPIENANTLMIGALETVRIHLESVREKNRARLIETAQTKFEVTQKRQSVQLFLQQFINTDGLVPKWFEMMMRFGWCEHLCFLTIRNEEGQGSYQRACQATQYLFDICAQVIQSRVALDPSLKQSVFDTLDFVRQDIKDQQFNLEALNHWVDKMTDIINGHENDLCHLVPPSHWYEPETKVVANSYDSMYTQHKLANISVGDWFYCPQFEREKTYLQVAWKASDQSKYLMVNHSFVNSGEYKATEFAALITSPGTRQITPSQLPFQPKGIEQHFYQIYDRMRNGLLRDPVSGFLVRADFERYVQETSAKKQLFGLVVCSIAQGKKMSTVYGPDPYNAAVSQICDQLNEFKNSWLHQNADYQILHMSRVSPEAIAFCIQSNKGDTVIDIQEVVQNFCLKLNRALKPLNILSSTVDARFEFSCVIVESSQVPNTQTMVSSAITAAEKMVQINASTQDTGEESEVHYVTLDQVKLASAQQAHAAWVLSSSLDRLQEKLFIEELVLTDSENQVHFRRFEVAERDSESQILEHFSKAERNYLLDQWLVSEAAQRFINSDEDSPIIVSLTSCEFQDQQFFETLFEKMAGLPPNKKIHFSFDAFNLPNTEFLVDFSLEVKSYGSQMFLRNWGLAPQSFQILQHGLFDQITFDESLVDQKDEKMEQLLSRIISVLGDYQITRIITNQHFPKNKISAQRVVELQCQLIETLREKK